MSQAHSGTESSIGSSTNPSIEHGRFTRAVAEAMTVEQVADRFYEVHSQSGSTYEIDLQTGACTCPDCEQRGEQYVCKHAIPTTVELSATVETPVGEFAHCVCCLLFFDILGITDRIVTFSAWH